jgi:hypothetical protein
MHKRQERQVDILSGDKIVSAERPAGHGTSVDTDLEIGAQTMSGIEISCRLTEVAQGCQDWLVRRS